MEIHDLAIGKRTTQVVEYTDQVFRSPALTFGR